MLIIVIIVAVLMYFIIMGVRVNWNVNKYDFRQRIAIPKTLNPPVNTDCNSMRNICSFAFICIGRYKHYGSHCGVKIRW